MIRRMQGVVLPALAIVFLWIGVAGAGETSDSAPNPLPPPSWDQKLPGKARFLVLSDFGNFAALDLETGLVWQRTPTKAKSDWAGALASCRAVHTGNRMGWRLPAFEEIATLIDPTQSEPALPQGHPFEGIGRHDVFWTATADVSNGFDADILDVSSVLLAAAGSDKAAPNRFWCVRGGQASSGN